jgi:shikimate 5-dehydrogenase
MMHVEKARKPVSVTLNGETRLFPIIGDPIKYARSPERMTACFAARG